MAPAASAHLGAVRRCEGWGGRREEMTGETHRELRPVKDETGAKPSMTR